jgi:hypothetical protein
MRARRIAVIATAGALVAGGAGAAIGATHHDEAKQAEAEILADAAKTLDTTPERLRDALAAAEDAQLDEAVKDGALTQAQADAIKQRRQESGRVLGIPHGHGPGFGGRGLHRRPGGPRGGGPVADVAKALGISVRQLFTRLRDGKTIAQIAKAEGKSLADVKATVRAAEKQRLDASVKAGRLTQSQADEILSHVDDRLDHLGEERLGRGRRGHHGPPGPWPAPPPEADGTP